MGFDLFVHRMRDDGDNLYLRAIAEAVFDRGALEPSHFQYVEYPDGCGEIHGDDDEEMIDGFMLSHFSGTTICERALEIATMTKSVISWPGSPICAAVTDREVIAHLPLDEREGLGEIAVIATVDDLWDAINREE